MFSEILILYVYANFTSSAALSSREFAVPTKFPMLQDLMTHIIKNNQIRQVPSFRKNMLDNIDKFLARLNFSCPILNRLVKNRYTEVSTQSLTLCTARSGLSCLFCIER